MAWRGCLYDTDLLRFLGVFGYGHRVRPDARVRAADQFQLSLYRDFDTRLLETLAYLPFDMVPGLSVHSAGREPKVRVAYALQPRDSLLSLWSMARREVAFCGLGFVSRDISCIGTLRPGRSCWPDQRCPACLHFARGNDRMGLVPGRRLHACAKN